MNKRARHSLLQNAAIILLSISAFVLLLRVISYETGKNGQFSTFSALLTSDNNTAERTAFSTDLTDMAAPFNLVISGAYGRSGILLGDAVTDPGDAVTDLLREALGSAEQMETVGTAVFQQALSFPSVYIDYLVALDADVVAGRLNAAFSHEQPIRYLLLASEDDSSTTLYLWDGLGAVCRYYTAVSVSALNEVIASCSPDGTFFAFEGGEEYAHLAPYSLMRHSAPAAAILSAAVPPLATDVDQLLSVLDFNVHTESRYKLSDGTEVVVESPRTVRIQPEGVLTYEGDETADSSIYAVPSAGETPTAEEAVLAARKLTEVLFASTDFSYTDLYLSGLAESGSGFTLEFRYMVNGIPVSFSDNAPALRMEIIGSTITSFTLRWRQYVPQESSYTLLPVRQAAAIAENYYKPYLTIGYADNGGSNLLPAWLAS